jgi:CBS domain-containing protein
MADTIRDVMTENPKTVEASATLREAAKLMDSDDVGAVLVVENGEVQGIVTDRDIVVRGIAKDKDPDDTSVREVATTELETVSPDDSVDEVIERFKQRDIRRVPVVEDGKPVGIVSLGDLARERDKDSVLGDISAAAPNN